MSKDSAQSWLGIVMHVFTIVVSVVCLTGAAYFYRQSQEALKDYVTEKSFSQYKLEHDKWAAEVLTQLRGDIADLKTTQRDMNGKLDQLLLRPTQRAELPILPKPFSLDEIQRWNAPIIIPDRSVVPLFGYTTNLAIAQ